MSDPTNNSDDILRKVSRRNLLRHSAITATCVALLPSFITGCNKDVWDKVKEHIPNGGLGGVGGEVLTSAELEQAAANLTTLRQLLIEVYDLAKQYDDAVFNALHSTKQDNWSNFIVGLFIDIGILITGALAVGSGGAAAMPAIAFLSAILHDWGFGKDKPDTLEDVYAEFEFGRVAMQDAIEDKLSDMVDPTDNYSNLQEAWKNPIEFQGTMYTLKHLGSEKFTLGSYYNKLHDAAYTQMKRAIWNLLILKCCTFYRYTYNQYIYDNRTFVEWARQEFYPKNKGVYLRGFKLEEGSSPRGYRVVYWNLGIGGNPFSDTASHILFLDDTPDHIINPKGLFHRSYVFEQFFHEKPSFLFHDSDGNTYHELATDPNQDFGTLADDWEYTRGLFPPE